MLHSHNISSHSLYICRQVRSKDSHIWSDSYSPPVIIVYRVNCHRLHLFEWNYTGWRGRRDHCRFSFVSLLGVQCNLAIRIPKLSPKTKDNARYPYNEVLHTAKLIPAGSGRCILISRISLYRVSLYRGYTVSGEGLWHRVDRLRHTLRPDACGYSQQKSPK